MEKDNFKSGFVTLVGRPNVGKSTLMNQLIGQKIAITSHKPQTTRNRIQTVHTDKNGQIIFIDTPGIHKPKNKLGQYMVKTAERTLNEVDLVLWLVEPRSQITEDDRYIAKQLVESKTPAMLIINKIDTVKREEILLVMNAYKDLCDFKEIIPVSALKGENVEGLMELIFDYLSEGPMYYDADTVTDQPERQIVAELIREKALFLLDEEVPHGIAVVVDKMKETKTNKGVDIVDIDATIICERQTHKGIIIGKGGKRLKEIGIRARKDIENLLACQVNLQLWVKVKKDWRDSDYLLRNFGYDKNIDR